MPAPNPRRPSRRPAPPPPPDLPAGAAPLALALRRLFRQQRRAVLASLRRPTPATKAPGDPLPASLSLPLATWTRLFYDGTLPAVEVIATGAARSWLARHGFATGAVGVPAAGPDATPDAALWRVVSHKIHSAIDGLTLTFCRETNATTGRELTAALADLREELREGIVEAGDTLPELTRRVRGVFERAETWRARAIASSEHSRAVHAAERVAGRESQVIKDWTWISSSDSCPFCLSLNGKTVPDGEPFAVVDSKVPEYREIHYAPAHPSCNCTVRGNVRADALRPGVSLADLARAAAPLAKGVRPAAAADTMPA